MCGAAHMKVGFGGGHSRNWLVSARTVGKGVDVSPTQPSLAAWKSVRTANAVRRVLGQRAKGRRYINKLSRNLT
jgi:hypothetical protein